MAKGGRVLSNRPRSKSEASSIEFADEIEFRLDRKKIKNLNLRIRPDGTVCVSAPLRMPLKRVKEFVASKKDWIARVQSEYENSPNALAERASDEEKAQWKELIGAFAPPLVEKWEDVLGVHANKLVYRNMKSRWGSCQPESGRICLNTRLALYPPECLEYVVVHELCHMRVRGHGKDFHDLMDAVMPDWKARRAKLR